jgi:hypothetical protein
LIGTGGNCEAAYLRITPDVYVLLTADDDAYAPTDDSASIEVAAYVGSDAHIDAEGMIGGIEPLDFASVPDFDTAASIIDLWVKRYVICASEG